MPDLPKVPQNDPDVIAPEPIPVRIIEDEPIPVMVWYDIVVVVQKFTAKRAEAALLANLRVHYFPHFRRREFISVAIRVIGVLRIIEPEAEPADTVADVHPEADMTGAANDPRRKT